MQDNSDAEKNNSQTTTYQNSPMETVVIDEQNKNNDAKQAKTNNIPEETTSEQLSPETFPESDSSNGELPPIYEENKNKYLFIGLGVIFFVILFILLLKVFSGIGKKSNKKISLSYWGLWEEKEAFELLINSFKQKNPNVSIEYIKMDPQNYRDKLIERSRNGRGPDIFRFHNTWLPTIKELVVSLPKNIMSDAEFEKTFYPVAQQDLKIGNSYYGLPLEIDGLILLYNSDLFKRAGLETSPKTWEEIIDYSTKLSVKDKEGKIITSGIALGTASNVEHFSDIFGWMLLQNGGNLKDLSTPEAIEVLEAYRKFAEEPKNVWDERMPNSISAFIQGKVAMVIAPSWQILVIKQSNPDLNLKTASLPIVPGGNQISIANYWVEGVSRFSKNQLEGWKFLRFLVEKENLTKFYTEVSKARFFGEPYSRIDLTQLLVQNEYIGPVIQQAQYMRSLPLISKTYDNGLNDEVIKYLEDAINNNIAGVSYKEALDTAKKGVIQVLGKYEIQ